MKIRRFEDQTVIVVGASLGIGACAARRFAAEGANLVLAARNLERLEAFVAELRALGGNVVAVAADIANSDDCKRLIERAAASGRIDHLINNAALHHRGPVSTVEPELLAQMVDVNLRAVVYLTALALPHLRANVVGGQRSVVQVASLAGCVPTPGSAVYSGTKFGVRAFSRALDEELRGTGVRIKVVSPGPVDTGFILEDLDRVTDLTLSQPMSTADEIAAAIVDAALDDRFERKMPGVSGALTTLGYFSPGLARALRPALERRGRAQKARLKAAAVQDGPGGAPPLPGPDGRGKTEP